MMEDGFPTIVDVNFTANMESLLDGVEEGKVQWKTIVENFYPDMMQAVEKAEKEFAIYRKREMDLLESDFDKEIKRLKDKNDNNPN